MRRRLPARMLLLVNHRAARPGGTHEEHTTMRTITINTRKNSLTKTLAVGIAVLGMGAMSVQPAQAAPVAPVASFASAPADDNRPAPKPRPAPRPTQLADAPEQSRSCYDHAYEVYLSAGW